MVGHRTGTGIRQILTDLPAASERPSEAELRALDKMRDITGPGTIGVRGMTLLPYIKKKKFIKHQKNSIKSKKKIPE